MIWYLNICIMLYIFYSDEELKIEKDGFKNKIDWKKKIQDINGNKR